MPQDDPAKVAANPRVAKLIELEVGGRIKPEHQTELDTYRAQGLAPKKSSGNSLTEYQGKSTGFHERALGADNDFLATAKYQNPDGTIDDGTSPVGYGGDIARAVLPANMVNSHTSTARKLAQQAKEDFIRASLRYESGAAIGPDEFTAQDRIFFPQTGDDEVVIKQKAKARQRVIESLKVAAGPGAANKAAPADKSALGTPVFNDSAAAAANQNPLKPEQQAAYDAWMKANPKATPDQLRAFGSSLGINLDNAEAIAAARDKGAGVASGATARETAPDISDVRGKGGLTEGADAAVRGFADTATLGFADELAAAGDTLFKDGTMRDNLSRQRAIDKYDAENSPWLRGGGQLAGGLALPIGSGARTIKELAGVGAATGGTYGVGSGETMGQRVTNGAIGTVTGAALGASFGKLRDLYQGRFPGGGGGSPRAQEAADLSQASNDLGVSILPADAGGPVTRYASALTRLTPGGAQPITAAARRSQTEGGAALSNMASREGSALNAEQTGEAVRKGALAYRSGSRDSISRAYNRAQEAAGDARVDPKKAVETLDSNIAALQEVPGSADGLAFLKGLRDDITSRGSVSIDGIRGMRTQMRQKFLKEGLTGSDLERRVNQVIEAASDDLANSLASQGKGEAARLFQNADRQWADRIKNLDDVIMPIIGKKGDKSGEQITQAINAAAKGNNARLGKLFEVLPEEEAGTARASLIEGLGRAKSGSQNAKGDEFSFDTFLTNWNDIGASAKDTIFRGESRKAIDQLALIAEKSKAASRYRNYSNTGLSVMGTATAGTGFASIPTLGAVLGGQYAAGRLLASPKVAKALLNIAQAKTPQALSTRVGSLSALAAKEPLLSSEITSLQGRLLNAMNDNMPGRAAASDGQQENEQR